MAAAKLVTRCPACRTAFRLVADQLRLRQGLVASGLPVTADPALFDFMALARSPATAVPSPPSAWTDATPDIGGAPGPA